MSSKLVTCIFVITLIHTEKYVDQNFNDQNFICSCNISNTPMLFRMQVYTNNV